MSVNARQTIYLWRGQAAKGFASGPYDPIAIAYVAIVVLDSHARPQSFVIGTNSRILCSFGLGIFRLVQGITIKDHESGFPRKYQSSGRWSPSEY